MSSFDTKCYIFVFESDKFANMLIDILEMNWKIKIWLIKDPFEKDPKKYNKTVIINLGFRIKWSTLLNKFGIVKDHVTYAACFNLMTDLSDDDKVIEKVKKNLNTSFAAEIKSIDFDEVIQQENLYANNYKRKSEYEPPKKLPRF